MYNYRYLAVDEDGTIVLFRDKPKIAFLSPHYEGGKYWSRVGGPHLLVTGSLDKVRRLRLNSKTQYGPIYHIELDHNGHYYVSKNKIKDTTPHVAPFCVVLPDGLKMRKKILKGGYNR